jgi:hypothetical protein
MIPWKHYVPIECDIHDLKSKWKLAEENPNQMKAISQEASNLAKYLLSKEYLDHIYQELFVDYLGSLVPNYISEEITWEEAKKQYEEFGYTLFPIGFCSTKTLSCTLQCRHGKTRKYPIHNVNVTTTHDGLKSNM